MPQTGRHEAFFKLGTHKCRLHHTNFSLSGGLAPRIVAPLCFRYIFYVRMNRIVRTIERILVKFYIGGAVLYCVDISQIWLISNMNF